MRTGISKLISFIFSRLDRREVSGADGAGEGANEGVQNGPGENGGPSHEEANTLPETEQGA